MLPSNVEICIYIAYTCQLKVAKESGFRLLKLVNQVVNASHSKAGYASALSLHQFCMWHGMFPSRTLRRLLPKLWWTSSVYLVVVDCSCNISIRISIPQAHVCYLGKYSKQKRGSSTQRSISMQNATEIASVSVLFLALLLFLASATRHAPFAIPNTDTGTSHYNNNANTPLRCWCRSVFGFRAPCKFLLYNIYRNIAISQATLLST
jgi:hypothetical protein